MGAEDFGCIKMQCNFKYPNFYSVSDDWSPSPPPLKKPYDSWKIFRNSEKKKASARQSFLMFYWLSIFVDGACRLVEEDHSKYDEKSHDESSVKKMSSAKIRNSSFEAEKGKNSLKISCYSFHLVCSISVISVTWWEKNYTLWNNYKVVWKFWKPWKRVTFFFLPILPLKNVTQWCSVKLLREFYLAD